MKKIMKTKTLFGIVLELSLDSVLVKSQFGSRQVLKPQSTARYRNAVGKRQHNRRKILKQDSITIHDPDGLIRFLVRQDSIVTIGADSILSNISLPKSSVNFKLGEINVPNINQRPVITLQDLVDASDTNTQRLFYYYNGKDTIFPAMSSPLGDTNYVAKANNYEYIHISKGYLKFTLTNNFPQYYPKQKLPFTIGNTISY